MKRKQKRVLQMTAVFTVALIFLPHVGLWALYKEKHLVKAAEPGEQQLLQDPLCPGHLWEFAFFLFLKMTEAVLTFQAERLAVTDLFYCFSFRDE
ncbi:hypothetical protein Y1Q_0021746 [Alligator mississippiensis]|uniref:Uncharacterized protein n=1 Tax=Alligator mississippiensis TaxID=8496 RepID=A0A151PAY7_ALLMI|nr:hypothetical protein Y1Q_0021746 [Alligator mississippiensis]